MKLSEKGLERVSEPILKFVDGYYDYAIAETLEDHEFEPDDFEGMVCLTVEEAKGIYDDLIRLSEMSSLDISRYYAWKRLNERIVKSEMSKQSTQCENVSKKCEKIITSKVEQAGGSK